MLPRKVAWAAAVLAAVVFGWCWGAGGTLVPSQPPAQPSQSAPASPGQVYPGTAACLLTTRDGDFSVFAAIQDTAGCSQWTQALAEGGIFWTPVPARAPPGRSCARWPRTACA